MELHTLLFTILVSGEVLQNETAHRRSGKKLKRKKKKRNFYVASHYSKNTSALNNEKNVGPIIEVIYDEGII